MSTNRVLIFLNGALERQRNQRERLEQLCASLQERLASPMIEVSPTLRYMSMEEAVAPEVLLSVCSDWRLDRLDDLRPGIVAVVRACARELDRAADRLEGGAV